MTYQFYADKQDKLNILDYIFNETDLKAFDLSSAAGEEIRSYKTTQEIVTKFDLENGKQFAVTFNLWSPEFMGEIIFQKRELNPKRCNGHTFKFTTEGWGLIQLYFGGRTDKRLYKSSIGHNSEKRALGHQPSIQRIPGPDQWDWKTIEQTSRKLKYLIHNKLSSRKIGGTGIMKGADSLEKSGQVVFS